MARIGPEVLSLGDEIVALRRDLHRHPELAWSERLTAARIESFLEGSGLALRTGLGGTGLLAEAGVGGPTLLLRVDMDALPVTEDSGAPYASEVAGAMHACGHDGHVAMGAAAARTLAAR